MLEDWLCNVGTGIGFSGRQELGVGGLFRRNLEGDFGSAQRLMPGIIDADAEWNLNTCLHNRGRLEADTETPIPRLSKGYSKHQRHKSKDLHVLSLGPTITLNGYADAVEAIGMTQAWHTFPQFLNRMMA